MHFKGLYEQGVHRLSIGSRPLDELEAVVDERLVPFDLLCVQKLRQALLRAKTMNVEVKEPGRKDSDLGDDSNVRSYQWLHLVAPCLVEDGG